MKTANNELYQTVRALQEKQKQYNKQINQEITDKTEAFFASLPNDLKYIINGIRKKPRNKDYAQLLCTIAFSCKNKSTIKQEIPCPIRTRNGNYKTITRQFSVSLEDLSLELGIRGHYHHDRGYDLESSFLFDLEKLSNGKIIPVQKSNETHRGDEFNHDPCTYPIVLDNAIIFTILDEFIATKRKEYEKEKTTESILAR